MEFSQGKLSKTEWESIEIPENEEERKILKMIMEGYSNVSIRVNKTESTMSFLKLTSSYSDEYKNCIDVFIYNTYFKSLIDKNPIFKDNKPSPKTKIKLKQKDVIRFEQNKAIPPTIFEFLLLNEIVNMEKNFELHYFTLFKLRQNKIIPNKFIAGIVDSFLERECSIKNIIYKCNEIIEKNSILSKYSDITLYEHQKKLFAETQTKNPKLILYSAPTGTGKTLSPLALSNNHKVIFVCAARHIGLSLAKSCITMGKKIAFAFGCETPDDIRLHYSAAKEFVKHKSSGGIFKVDNTVGDKVEIIICDLYSYLPAMYYMSAFNSIEDIIVQWDEPTITLDYESHPFHEIISKNWKNNIIPNIILSSATLPTSSEINNTISDYILKFNGEIITINSYECKKSIPLIHDGSFILPHTLTNKNDELQKIIGNCLENLSLLRYFELCEVTKVIEYVNENDLVHAKFGLERHFTHFDITPHDIKVYYLKLLAEIDWEIHYTHFSNKIEINMIDSKGNKTENLDYSQMFLTTKDAYSLTDGPTIFLTESIEKVAQFFIQEANIPQKSMDDIMKTIDYNNDVNKRIIELEKKIEDIQQKDSEEKDKKEKKEKKESARFIQELNMTQQLIKPAFLNNIFIPNKLEHCRKWASRMTTTNSFTSNIEESVVIKIMSLDVECSWKVLLLLGIGVFAQHKSIDYTELMKQMAKEQKLFLIIANSDYIYGTNYQFCHGYISKDLQVTQDKLIQAIGRVGRNSSNSEYSVRFRDKKHANLLFYPFENKAEVTNMNRLFS